MTFNWDNNDINAETLTGVSMHYTNGIKVQICTSKQDLNISRKISFSSLPNTMGYYVSKKRVDSSHLAQADLEESIKSSLSNSQFIDFIWTLSGYVAPELIPYWTSFNYLIHKKGKVRTFKKLFTS